MSSSSFSFLPLSKTDDRKGNCGHVITKNKPFPFRKNPKIKAFIFPFEEGRKKPTAAHSFFLLLLQSIILMPQIRRSIISWRRKRRKKKKTSSPPWKWHAGCRALKIEEEEEQIEWEEEENRNPFPYIFLPPRLKKAFAALGILRKFCRRFIAIC